LQLSEDSDFCFVVPILQGEVERGKTTGYIYLGAIPIGFFSLSDACRLRVQEAIGQLKSLGIKTAMLTGDNQSAAMQVQDEVCDVILIWSNLCEYNMAKL